MAKGKGKNGVPNKHIHARISYLQQAATYLTLQGERHATDSTDRHGHAQTSSRGPIAGIDGGDDTTPIKPGLNMPPSGGLPLHLTSHLRQVALKTQIRLHTNIKHSVCKACSTVLVEGQTCSKRIENLSRLGRKSHADVLVTECGVCGAAKRFPVGSKRQVRRSERGKAKNEQQEARQATQKRSEATLKATAVETAPG